MRLGPIKWHCSQTASRSEGSRFAGLTIVASAPAAAVGALMCQLSGPVAALAADGVALSKHRCLVTIVGACDPLGPVGVAEETLREYGPIEARHSREIARRQAPPALVGIPGDGRLEQEAVALDQVRESLPARADHVLDQGLLGVERGPGCIATRLLMNHAISLMHDRIN